MLDPGYLLDAAEHGDERTRFQFVKARIIFSRIPELEGTVTSIAAYPENERIEKMKSFYSQMPLHSSFMELAEYSQNAYLLSETAVALVLFGGRLILAHNRMLYPGREWFMREFEKAPDKPEGIIDPATQLLRNPGIAHARAFMKVLPTTRTGRSRKEGTGSASMKITSGTGATADSHRRSDDPQHVSLHAYGVPVRIKNCPGLAHDNCRRLW